MSGEVLLTTAPHPFKVERHLFYAPEGLTVAEMFTLVQPDRTLGEHAIASVNGHHLPRDVWSRVRPKAGTHLEFRVLPAGGGGGGGKNVMRMVLMVAVLAASIWLGPSLGATLAGFQSVAAATAAGATVAGVGFATFGTALIGLTGMLLVNVVAPIRPPSLSNSSGNRDSQTLFIEGARNRADPFGPVPVVLGKHRLAPRIGATPYTEVIGGKNFLRLLFVWGVGPLEIDEDSLTIGETPLSAFEGVQVEHRKGYPDDEPLTLYPRASSQENFTIVVTQEAGWLLRTTLSDDADEVGVDVTFPAGLMYTDDGKHPDPHPWSVTIQVQYRKVGDSMWLTPSYTATTFPTSWVSGDSITFTHQKTSAVRHGFRWSVAERGQYEVRIRKTSTDQTEQRFVELLHWTALRTFTNENPINSPVPLAMTALVIQATDQLNGIVDELKGVVTSIGKRWSGTQWVDDQPIQNCADIGRLVLQGNGSVEPLPDDRLDLPAWQRFHQFCENRGYKFNMVRDFRTSQYETLLDVCAAGRGAPVHVDGKWSVIFEEEKAYPVSHVTPRNSFDFRVQRAYLDRPHAVRVRFNNEREGYRQDEHRVYLDGYDANNATKFETQEYPGVTDPDQIYDLARFRVAQAVHQPERWTYGQDLEYLTYRRGDRIKITHDVLLVGLKYGRVKSVDVDTNDQVVGLTIDEEITMEAGKNYGISIRGLWNASITKQVVTTPGTTKTLTLTTPIGTVDGEVAVRKHDLFGFGLLGQETDDASVISIVPESEFRARVIAVPYRSVIFEEDAKVIPPFKTRLTPLPELVEPVVRGVVSDETALARGVGDSAVARIVIDFDPLEDTAFRGVRTRVQIRPSESGEPFYDARVDSAEPSRVILSDVTEGQTYDLRLRFEADGRLPGPWTRINNHRVVGRTDPPSGLANLTVSAYNGQALLRWSSPPELDVVFGGEVRFRHSPEFTGATWANSHSIGEIARARDLQATLPLKPGTYLARVYDQTGRPCDLEDIASVTTKQVSVLEYAAVSSINEAPGFNGERTSVAPDAGALKLAGTGLFDDIADLDALTEELDELGGIISEGEYLFDSGLDLGSVRRVRLTTRISMVSENVFDEIDDREEFIDQWEDFDGITQAETDCVIYVRHTDEDPATLEEDSASWSAWERLDSAEFEARGFEFKANLSTQNPAFNVRVSELGVDVEELA